jgi:thiamine phosphate synthase YjbQ (UPF0047 family)
LVIGRPCIFRPEGQPVIEQKILEFRTPGRGTTEITAEIARAVADSGIRKGLYLWEHRHAPHSRSIVVTVMGEG